ncbi:MAG: cation:proton antiporter, partial [Planctomycetes bacterium]|nr:cation:proton antiporter [Planctomycetota bacterium]
GSLGAWLGGMSGFDALSVAIGMNARGAMEIILAMIGMRLGIISTQVFAVLVLVAIVTSLMTAPLLKWRIARERR